jgi:hypothetical protein
MNKEMFFHVGYPKAASTTLQKALFNNHKDILNLGIYPISNIGYDTDMDSDAIILNDDDLKNIYRLLANADSIEFNEEEVIQLIKKIIDKYSGKTDKVILFSKESITSTFFAHPDIISKAERINKAFSDIKIIFIIRNQVDWIKSQYRDHPFNPKNFFIGEPVSIDEFIEIGFSNEDVYFPNSLLYYEVLQKYSAIFGKENIGVFLFEELVTDVVSFSNKISKFMNIDASETFNLLNYRHENETVSKNYNLYRSFIRKHKRLIKMLSFLKTESLKKYLESYLKKGEKHSVEISDKQLLRINHFYEKSNKNLSEKYDLNLKEYGYYL